MTCCARPRAVWSVSSSATALASNLNFLGATLVLLALLDGRPVAGLRGVLAHHRRQDRRRDLERHRLDQGAPQYGAGCRGGSRSQEGARRSGQGGRETCRHARQAAHRGARGRGRKERARREGTAGADVRRTEVRRTAAAQAARRSAGARGQLFAGIARSDVAPGRAQAQGFRRRGGSGRRAARPRGHALSKCGPRPASR